MSKVSNKYDEKGNLIYYRNISGDECWAEYNKNNNLIYHTDSEDYEVWYKYDENNNEIYFKNSSGYELWNKYDKNNNRTQITKKEYKKIQYNIKIKEYNSRTKCSRFKLMDI